MSLFIPSGAGLLMPASATWTPADLPDLYQWFDAQDSSTITKDGSNYVTQWNDKSGNAGHITASGTGGPTYNSSTLNSRAAMVFPGTDYNMLSHNDVGLDFLRAQDGVTIVMVLEHVTRSSGGYFFCYSNGAYNNYARCLMSDYGSGRLAISLRQSDSDSRYNAYSAAGSPIPEDTPIILRISINYAGQKPYIYCSATGDTTDILQAGNLPDTDPVSDTRSIAGSIGGYLGSALNVNHKLGEMLMIRDVLTADEITSLNTYLRTKWGIS